MSEQLMTQEELAFRWKISEATLERDRSLKQGCRYMKIGGLIRYKMQDVLEYEDACTHEPKAAKLREKNAHPSKPLTDEQIIQLAQEWPAETNDWASHIDFARAIEAAHGIKGDA